MGMKTVGARLGICCLGTAACGAGRLEDRFIVNFDFSNDQQGWVAGASDFPVGREEDIQFVADHRTLPPPLDQRGALFQSGLNISDDLFMYFTRRIAGLVPSGRYDARFRVEYASNVGAECVAGVGGSVWIKAGASRIEPQRVEDEFGNYRMNIDKGEQLNDGRAAVVLGDIRNELPGCPSTDPPYGTNAHENGDPLLVTAANDGSLWLLVGTESGFEAEHHLYFLSFRVELVAR